MLYSRGLVVICFIYSRVYVLIPCWRHNFLILLAFALRWPCSPSGFEALQAGFCLFVRFCFLLHESRCVGHLPSAQSERTVTVIRSQGQRSGERAPFTEKGHTLSCCQAVREGP